MWTPRYTPIGIHMRYVTSRLLFLLHGKGSDGIMRSTRVVMGAVWLVELLSSAPLIHWSCRALWISEENCCLVVEFLVLPIEGIAITERWLTELKERNGLHTIDLGCLYPRLTSDGYKDFLVVCLAELMWCDCCLIYHGFLLCWLGW